jgi:hypothetical protein
VRSDKGWTATATGGGIGRSQRPVARGPQLGDVTLLPVTTDGAVGSSLTADDPSEIWQAFKSGDHTRHGFDGNGARDSDHRNPPPGAGVGAGAGPFDARGTPTRQSSGHNVAHGAAAVSATVPAGESATLSIVFTWHFPDRDFSHEILGNRCVIGSWAELTLRHRLLG